MRNYELVVILSPILNQDESADAWDRIKGFINNRSGEITHEEKWGTRRLAYPIRKGQHQFLEGTYHLTRFSTDQPFNQELETFLRLEEQVLRSLVVVAQPFQAPPQAAPVEAAQPEEAPVEAAPDSVDTPVGSDAGVAEAEVAPVVEEPEAEAAETPAATEEPVAEAEVAPVVEEPVSEVAEPEGQLAAAEGDDGLSTTDQPPVETEDSVTDSATDEEEPAPDDTAEAERDRP